MLARMRPPALVLSAALLLAAMVFWLQRAGAANSAVLVFAVVAGLGAGSAALWRSEPRPLRRERDVVAALGEPLIAARPFAREAVRALARQLLEHWFTPGRRLLPIVELGGGHGAAALAAELGHALAGMGARTLLVDGDLRAPRLHSRFGVARGRGLADVLDGLDSRDMRLVRCGENLALLTAGRVRELPLELLSRARLRRLLDPPAQPFDAVLVCTPPLARGPDFEIFAALAGGALVFAAAEAGAADLAALSRRLARCTASVVGTVLERSA
jgi:Mrp family chromosome partitioning ATPase